MARPLGAQNKHKPFKAALNRLLDEAGNNPTALDDIAQALRLKALEGDVTAIREIADRLDGKVAQPIAGDQDNPLNVISEVRITFVKAIGHAGGGDI